MNNNGGTPLTTDTISAALTTTLLGNRIKVFPQVGSTNEIAREAGRRGESEGLVVLADEQTAGRGRLGRKWVAPPGCCILCSVLLRPRFSAQQAFYLTAAASFAIYCAVVKLPALAGSAGRLECSIKWPNDVMVRGRKVSGVLCESEFRGGAWDFVVLGFGINANLSPEQLDDLAATATSLSVETGTRIDRVALLSSVLCELESLYLLLQSGDFHPVFSEWRAALETPGKRVSVQGPHGRIEGMAMRVDYDGALIVQTEAGREVRVVAGDILAPGAEQS